MSKFLIILFLIKIIYTDREADIKTIEPTEYKKVDRENELVIKKSLKKGFLKGIPKKSEIQYLVIKTS